MAVMNPRDTVFASPIVCPPQRVEPGWIDYNGHMNMAYYSLAFDRALDHVFDLLGIGADYTASGAGSVFALESHVHFLQELSLGDPLRIEFQLLDHDAKRLHFCERMYHAEQGYLAAVCEQLSLHVAMSTRRAAPLPAAAQSALAAMQQAHRDAVPPPQVGRVIGIRRAPRENTE